MPKEFVKVVRQAINGPSHHAGVSRDASAYRHHFEHQDHDETRAPDLRTLLMPTVCRRWVDGSSSEFSQRCVRLGVRLG